MSKPHPGRPATSDYITCAASTYRVLQASDLPADHPVEKFNRIYQALAGDDGVIDRQRFDPTEHRDVLPWVQIFEVHEGPRYKARLLGTGVTTLLHGDFTGWYLDDYISGEILDHRNHEFGTTNETKSPIFSMSVIQSERVYPWEVYRGIFPARQSDMDLLFVILAPENERIKNTAFL